MPARDKYTKPDLRDKVKKQVQESDKGGAPGQWSARKAQMMASEYKKQGGDYTTDKETGQDESQKNLSKWGEQDWQTKEGSGDAKQDDGTQKRYLPKKAWEEMNEDEKEETDQKKQKASKKGQQHVENTEKAKNARSKAEKGSSKQNETNKAQKTNAKGTKKNKETYEGADEEGAEDETEEAHDLSEQKDDKDESADEDEVDDQPAPPSKKRGPPSKDQGSNKKQKANSGDVKGKASGKTVGSKHDPAEPPAQQGSAKRLPKVGQSVQWKALPGWVKGKVIEIAYEDKEVRGKRVKGSKNDPRIVLETESGKIAGHKPEAMYFD